MNYFVLIYDVVGDYLSRRTAYREEHLRLAREANHRGELLLAGAFSDPADRTLFIFHVQNKSAIEEFIHNDPVRYKWVSNPVGNPAMDSRYWKLT